MDEFEIILEPARGDLLSVLSWSLNFRRTYFSGLSKGNAEKWLRRIGAERDKLTGDIEEKLCLLFGMAEEILCEDNLPARSIEALLMKWKRIECILDGSLKEILGKLSSTELAAYFNSLINEDHAYEYLEQKTLRWNADDQFALNADLILIDETQNNVILIELKYRSKYNANQFLKYLRLRNAFKHSGYDVRHLLIGRHPANEARKNIQNPSILFSVDSMNGNKLYFDKLAIEKEKLLPKWRRYYEQCAADSYSSFPLEYYSYSDLFQVSSERDFERISMDLEFLKTNFH